MGAGSTRRLGVGRALVVGVWTDGDVEVDAAGLVVGVGRAPAGPAGRVAVPGLVDLQVNGAFGIDVVGASVASLAALAGELAENGVVAFTPTTFSASVDQHRCVLEAVAAYRGAGSPGAEVPGVHLEGPFLSRSWAGAHDPTLLLDPDPDVMHRLLDAGPVAMVTLAPEARGAIDLVRMAVEHGAVVSVGHTDATAVEVRAALDAGASALTHVFNAHRRLTARDPGPAGVALTDPRCRVGVIADGHHLAPEVLRLVLAAAGERTIVVSDAVAPAGTGDGPAVVRGRRVRVEGGRVTLEDGTLSGSATLLDGSLRHLVGLGVDPAVALHATATAPARLLGLGPHDLRPGSAARAIVLDDRWEVVS